MKNWWNTFKKETLSSQHFFVHLAKFPLKTIQELPSWKWPTLIGVHIAFSSLSGALAGFVEYSSLYSLIKIFTHPVTAGIVVFISTLFLYYSTQFFFEKGIEFKSLATLVIISSIPFHLFHTISPLLSPIDLFAFSFSAILVTVGLVDNFHTPKIGSIRLVAMVWICFVLVWIFGRFSDHRKEARYAPVLEGQMSQSAAFKTNM